MNITDFLDHLHKTRGWQLDADYYSHIETWRQWGKGNVPGVHTRAAEYADGTSGQTPTRWSRKRSGPARALLF